MQKTFVLKLATANPEYRKQIGHMLNEFCVKTKSAVIAYELNESATEKIDTMLKLGKNTPFN